MEACPPPACHYQHPGEPSQQAPSPSPDIEASGEAEGMQQQLAAGRGAAPACTAAEAATAFGVRCTDGWCAFVRGIWSGSAGLFVPAWIWLWIWPAGFGLDLACWFRPGSSLGNCLGPGCSNLVPYIAEGLGHRTHTHSLSHTAAGSDTPLFPSHACIDPDGQISTCWLCACFPLAAAAGCW